MVEDRPRSLFGGSRRHPIASPNTPDGLPEFGTQATFEDPDSRAWVGVVANANSGVGASRGRVDRLVRSLERRGLQSVVAWTPQDRQLMVQRTSAEADCRCLVAVGGDGTVAALINERPRVPITVLPAGTENLFARHFHLSHHSRKAAETIELGSVLPLDLGEACGRRFALMAGIGFDAEVVTRHHLARLGQARRIRTTSRVAYVEPVLRASFGYGFPKVSVLVEDPGPPEELVGSMAFIFNLPRYAIGLPIAPTAKQDDGLLDLVVFRDPGPLAALHYLWLVFRGLHLSHPGVWHRRVRRLSVTSDSVVPVQLDGDPGGTIEPGSPTPWAVQVLPRAVSVLVPERDKRSKLAS